MKENILTVSGMSCGHCVNSIEGTIGNLQGVSYVQVDLREGKVKVTFDEKVVTLELIKVMIVEQGYEVELSKLI